MVSLLFFAPARDDEATPHYNLLNKMAHAPPCEMTGSEIHLQRRVCVYSMLCRARGKKEAKKTHFGTPSMINYVVHNSSIAFPLTPGWQQNAPLEWKQPLIWTLHAKCRFKATAENPSPSAILELLEFANLLLAAEKLVCVWTVCLRRENRCVVAFIFGRRCVFSTTHTSLKAKHNLLLAGRKKCYMCGTT
jgi:hypothetical protein